MPTWKLSGVGKAFGRGNGRVEALRDIDLTVADHELLIILGPAGSGKSTLLRLLAGLEFADTGTLSRDEEDMTRLPPDRRDIAMVFQNFAVYPHLTVKENLVFPLRHGRGGISSQDIEKRVITAVEMLGIGDLLDRHPGTLSGGELQRVAIGRSLVRRPSLFLFDEPLINLDAKLREGLRSELHRIQRETRTAMVYATHDQAEAMALADKLAILDRGRLLQIGGPEMIYARPADSRVARLLGMPPINLFSLEQAKALGLPLGDGSFAGLRPEFLSVVADREGSATLSAIERLGHAEVLVLEAAGQILRAYVQGHSGLNPGERVKLTVEPQNLLWFKR